jgi:NhaP-type Na+/H+ or K+/H+ antiporter
MKKNIFAYLVALFSLAFVALGSHFAPEVFHFFESNSEHGLINIFFEIAVIFVLSFIIFYVSHVTKLPSFVMAIFFGIAAHDILRPLVEEREILSAIVGFGATLILFGGGLETPFHNFKKLFWKIFSLSFPGLLITAFLFSVAVLGLSTLFNGSLSVMVAVLLGAVLASTDPAAIIPVLKRLRFFNRSTKDIIVSESAVTDVTGTLLTVAFLGIATTGVAIGTITGWYKTIFTAEVGGILFKQLAFGVLFGVLGYFFLELLKRFKKGHEKEFEADSALFLFIPVIIFTIALSLGGSGYLAAFIAGLLFNLTEHLHETERFFNHMIEGFFKPVIFILLGALVDIQQLFEYAGIGIAIALIFMFVIRPFIVFLTLGPFSFFGKDRLSWREVLFISFVRETGAIPAVLLVTVVSLGVGDMSGLVPIGMWVILLTLIIEPLLTPYVAQKLKVAELIGDEKKVHLNGGETPWVILGTRGRSFIARLPFVAEWATKHSIEKVGVLLCLEEKYTLELAQEIEKEALQEFEKVNTLLVSKGLKPLQFNLIVRTGFLHQNINALSQEQKNITAIFVGKKMLDFRLEQIKQLGVPLYFVE